MSHPQYIFILFFSLWCWLSPASATCWNNNQSDRNAGLSIELYRPCNPNSAVASMCCRLPGTQDICQTNGLCKDSSGELWRESCTDQTWQSPNCIKLCVDGTAANSCYCTDEGGPRSSHDVRITQCQGDTGIYCCGSNVTDSVCCQNGFRIEQGQAKAVNATSTSTATSAGSTTSTSSTPAGTASPSPSPVPPAHHTNIGAAVGGAIGGAAIVIIGALWYLFARRRRRSAGSPTSGELAGWTSKVGDQKKDSKSYGMDAVTAGKPVHEVGGFQGVEIDGQTMPPELEGNKRQSRPGELE